MPVQHYHHFSNRLSRDPQCRPWATLILLAITCLFLAPAVAGPWIDPGDIGLRHDVQMLSDAGIVHAPLTSWPLAWVDVVRDIHAYDGDLSPDQDAARLRLLREYRRESRLDEVLPHVRIAAAEHPREYRTFQATPREGGELEAGAEWTGDILAYRLQMTAVDAPDDDKPIRFDGSYVAAIWGNWAFSADEQPRWWGPGWEGSLILSNNARPVPSVTVQRLLTDPFESKWLHWLGPWQFLFTMGELEGSRYVPNALLMGMRLDIRPVPSFELGMTRTAQWGGQGRPENWSTFEDVLLGRDNLGSNGINAANEPGNQLAGFDFRWQSPLFTAPYAVYGQFIGEDEAGGWPSRYIGLGGIETWGAWSRQGASWRLHGEYADTATGGFYDSQPLYNYAYQHHIYKSGYTYYSRFIGHSLGGDGRMTSLGLLYETAQGQTWDILLRRIQPERDVTGNPVYINVELGHQFWWRSDNKINLRLAASRRHTTDGTSIQGQIDGQWEWQF